MARLVLNDAISRGRRAMFSLSHASSLPIDRTLASFFRQLLALDELMVALRAAGRRQPKPESCNARTPFRDDVDKVIRSTSWLQSTVGYVMCTVVVWPLLASPKF